MSSVPNPCFVPFQRITPDCVTFQFLDLGDHMDEMHWLILGRNNTPQKLTLTFWKTVSDLYSLDFPSCLPVIPVCLFTFKDALYLLCKFSEPFVH